MSVNSLVELNTRIPLLLFAKAPIPGKVKTRLQTNCTAEQAAEIACLLLELTLQNACESWPGDVYLSSWLDIDHPSLLRLSKRFNVPLIEQCDGTLGEKMQDAFDSKGYPMAIMGCDAPHAKSETLVEMHSLIRQGESAIAPSLDGGYYLIGLSERVPTLFCDIPWGTSDVLRLTRERAHQTCFNLLELATLQDIDEWGDLIDAKDELPILERYLIDQQLIN